MFSVEEDPVLAEIEKGEAGEKAVEMEKAMELGVETEKAVEKVKS